MSYKIIINLDDSGVMKTTIENIDNINMISGGLLVSELEFVKIKILSILGKFRNFEKSL